MLIQSNTFKHDVDINNVIHKILINSYIIIFILLMLLLFLYYSFNIKKISLLVIGTFFTLSFFALILIINQIPLNNFLIQYFLYPMTVGSSRVESLNFDLKGFIGHFKYIYICLIPLFVVLLKMILKRDCRSFFHLL